MWRGMACCVARLLLALRAHDRARIAGRAMRTVSFSADNCQTLCHSYVAIRAIRKGRAIADDDKRWMIRGVDREIRKAIKDAAKAEGVSVGTWVRRCLVRGLDASADAPATMMDLSEHMRMLGSRLTVLEKSYRALHQEVHVANGRGFANENRARWRRTKRSK